MEQAATCEANAEMSLTCIISGDHDSSGRDVHLVNYVKQTIKRGLALGLAYSD